MTRLTVPCVVLIWGGLCTLPAFPAAEEITATDRRAVLGRNFTNQPIPKWEGKYFLARDLDNPTAFVFDPAGQKQFETTLTVPGSSRVYLRDLAASRGGVVAAAGSAIAYDGVAAGFIAWLSASGRIDRLVSITPYFAQRICFGHDDTLWALVRQPAEPGARTGPEHELLRQYAMDGRLLRALLPKAAFRIRDHRHPTDPSFLACSGDRVGIYSVPANEWIEISTATGEVVGRYEAISSTATYVTGVILTASGAAYASAQHRDATSRRTTFSFHKLDRSSRKWMPLGATRVAGPDGTSSAAVHGADGESLVIGKELPEFVWAKTPGTP